MTDVAMPRLIVPALGGIYRIFAPYTETLIRIVAGLSFVPHGYPKLFVNPARSAAFLAESGFEPGMFWAILLGSTEFFGGLLLAAGFLTRLACIPLFIFLITAITHHWPNGFTWIEEGFEYPLFWAIVVFHFLIHGGGRYSADAMLGREV
jgi:putative oxidoreductase